MSLSVNDITRIIRASREVIQQAQEKAKLETKHCEHHFPIPNIGTCCGYYSKTRDAYNMKWAHYPECCEENCPIKHPELVAGYKLESEIETRCRAVRMIPVYERDGKRCFFCGTKLSVMCIVEVDTPAKAPVPFRVHSCNMCALIKVR